MSKYSEKAAQTNKIATVKAHVSPAPPTEGSERSKRRANRNFDGVTKPMKRAIKFPKLKQNGK
jgi:hypothetical protein